MQKIKWQLPAVPLDSVNKKLEYPTETIKVDWI